MTMVKTMAPQATIEFYFFLFYFSTFWTARGLWNLDPASESCESVWTCPNPRKSCLSSSMPAQTLFTPCILGQPPYLPHRPQTCPHPLLIQRPRSLEPSPTSQSHDIHDPPSYSKSSITQRNSTIGF